MAQTFKNSLSSFLIKGKAVRRETDRHKQTELPVRLMKEGFGHLSRNSGVQLPLLSTPRQHGCDTSRRYHALGQEAG